MSIGEVFALFGVYCCISLLLGFIHHALVDMDCGLNNHKFFYEKKEIKLYDIPAWLIYGGALLVGVVCHVLFVYILIPVWGKIAVLYNKTNITLYTKKDK